MWDPGMTGPMITCVLLTTHPKRAAYLPDAIRSYRAQTYENKELLIVNDGEPLASKAPDIRIVNLVSKPTRWTIGEKRNVGIRMSHGAWLATWDDDDISLSHRLEEQMRAALANDADYVLGTSAAVSDEKMRVVGHCHRGAIMASALIRKNAAVSAGGYSTSSYLEDFEMLQRVKIIARGRVVREPSDWYVLRRHDSNVTLGFGETADEYVACALRDPRRDETQRLVDRIRASGDTDLVVAL